MKTLLKMNTTIAVGAFALAVVTGHAAAQTQTMHIETNGCSVTVSTSISTNGSGGSCGMISLGGDPTMLQAMPGGAMGGVKIIHGNGALQGFPTITGGRGGMVISSTGAAPTGPVTWLGVSADEASTELRAQLPALSGAGLVVRNVSADSPAAKAGIAVNDILVNMDGQLLVNPPQLQTLLATHKAGDQVNLKLLRAGEQKTVKATLVKKELEPGDAGGPQVIDLGSFNLDPSKIFGQLGTNNGPVVIKRFYSSSSTNMIDDADVQKLIESTTRRVMEQMKNMPQPKDDGI